MTDKESCFMCDAEIKERLLPKRYMANEVLPLCQTCEPKVAQLQLAAVMQAIEKIGR